MGCRLGLSRPDSGAQTYRRKFNQRGLIMGKSLALRGVAVAGLVAATSAANAAAVDVAGVVTDIGAQAAPIGLIGAAVLLIYVGVKAFKWVRGALS
jgi:hypothetical protein